MATVKNNSHFVDSDIKGTSGQDSWTSNNYNASTMIRFLAGLNDFDTISSQDIVKMFDSTLGGIDTSWGTNGGWGDEFTGSLGRCRDIGFASDDSVYICYTSRPNEVDGNTVKLDPDGIIDTSFGSSGFVAGGTRALVVDDSDGSIFVAQAVAGGVGGAVVTKYDSSGIVVTAFGVDGSLIYPVAAANRQVALTTNNMLIRNGNLYICSSVSATGLIPGFWFNVTAHDTITGDLDTTWGVNGFSPTIDSGSFQHASTIQFDSTGRMYVHVIDFEDSGSLYRLGTDGLLDTGFLKKHNAEGEVAIPAGHNKSAGRDILVDEAGDIWVLYSLQNIWSFFLKKYNPSGTLLLNIGFGGSAFVQGACIVEAIDDIYIGCTSNFGGYGTNLIKMSKDGVVDESFQVLTGDPVDIAENVLVVRDRGFVTGTQDRTVAHPVDYSHLEGETVQVLGDGSYLGTDVVVNGNITLDDNTTNNHVGLAFTSKLQPMKLNGEVNVKRISRIIPNVNETVGGDYGESEDNLYSMVLRDSGDILDTDGELYTGYVVLPFDGSYTRQGDIVITQDEPFGMKLLGIGVDLSEERI